MTFTYRDVLEQKVIEIPKARLMQILELLGIPADSFITSVKLDAFGGEAEFVACDDTGEILTDWSSRDGGLVYGYLKLKVV